MHTFTLTVTPLALIIALLAMLYPAAFASEGASYRCYRCHRCHRRQFH